MKIALPILLVSLITLCPCYAQNLFNSKKDTLWSIETYYNSTLKEKKEFQYTLEPGLYFLIFDISIDPDSLTLHINIPYDAPILYQKHNGYYSFELQNSSVINVNINYHGKLKSSGLFAKLYTVAPTPIGSPYPDFNVKDINGQAFKSSELTGRVTLFFLWNPDSKSGKEYYQLLNEMSADFDEVRFVAWSRYPSKTRKFMDRALDSATEKKGSNFRFVADKWQKLGWWTKVFGGIIILIVNKQGQLEYKNRIFENNTIFKSQLKEAIKAKLNALI